MSKVININLLKEIKIHKNTNVTIMVLYNITKNVTKKHIEEIFSTYGKINGIYIPKDENSKMYKTYAFIEFEKRECAEKASLYMDGGQIDGVIVKTEILEPKNCVLVKNI